MTLKRDLKAIVRDHQAKTGQSYSTARAHVMRTRSALLGGKGDDVPLPSPTVVEAIVLKTNQASARVQVLGDHGQLTFRARAASELTPGHIARLTITKRWTYRGDPYASGAIDDTFLDVERLGLDPLPLEDCGLHHFDDDDEVVAPDPYAPLWRRLTAAPRRAFEMDAIAWGGGPLSEDEDEDIVCEAVELAEIGDMAGARDLLMGLLGKDLRCIDAHAHLGNQAFQHSPREALEHYEVGVGIAELSLPTGFDGLMPWSMLNNRPLLRALSGQALCLWRLGRPEDAIAVFERILALNPLDQQGARFCWNDARQGLSWEQATAADAAQQEPRASLR